MFSSKLSCRFKRIYALMCGFSTIQCHSKREALFHPHQHSFFTNFRHLCDQVAYPKEFHFIVRLAGFPPKAVAKCVLPVPGCPIRMMLSRFTMYSPRINWFTNILFKFRLSLEIDDPRAENACLYC